MYLLFFFRFKLKLRVIDATDSTTFVVFDRDASAMLKKSCSDIFDLQDKVKFHMYSIMLIFLTFNLNVFYHFQRNS